jgi:hypothetical protein
MFYSQQLVKHQVENLCVTCETRFTEWSVYHSHVTMNKCKKKILPIKTTNRTKAQIVRDVESTWGSALIG